MKTLDEISGKHYNVIKFLIHDKWLSMIVDSPIISFVIVEAALSTIRSSGQALSTPPSFVIHSSSNNHHFILVNYG